jgi:alkylhydroperoxidase family enzyme
MGGAYPVADYMFRFPIHSLMSALGGSKPFVSLAQRIHRRVPNLIAELVESPQAIEAYFVLGTAFERSELTAQERQIVLLAASIEHERHYCTVLHASEAEHEVVATVVLKR